MLESAATGLSSKPSEHGDQRKQLPYSVETPYGFHLDLDFLKYVDDIEKGNTIRRVLIQRRTKAPKFSTLPRNFSLPDNSSRSLPRESWTSTCSLVPRSTSRDVEVQQIFEFRAAAHVSVGVSPRAPGVTSRSERAAAGDVRTRAFDEQPLGFRVRPQLLRASSMPVTVLQRKNSENSEDQTEPLPGHSTKDNGSSENVFCSNDCSSTQETAKNCEAVLTSEVSNLRQQLAAALQRIKVLEEQVKTIPELTEQVSTLTEEKGNLILQLNRQLAVSVQGFPQTTGSENTEHEKHSLHSLTSNSTAKNQIASSTDVLASATPLTTKASEDHSHSQQQKISTDHKELASTPMGSSLQDVAVCVTEGGAGSAAQKTNSDTEALTSIALRTKLTVLEKQLSDTTKELEKANTLLKQKVEENKVKELMLEQQSEQENSSPQLKGAEVGEQTEEVVKSKQSDYVQRCNASVNTEASSEVKTFSDKGTTTDMQIPTGSVECGAGTTITETPKKDLRSSSIQTDSLEVRSVGVVASVQTGEKSIAATVSACDKTIETDQPLIHVTCKPVEKKVADLEKESECMKQCASSRESDLTSVVGDCKSKEECVREVAQDCKKEGKGDREEPMPSSSMQATIGHYVTKIQQLLHEQWAVLENGYPELTSTLKQPASKISSIQEQLVSSLNALSSMYSSQAEKEATNGSSAQQAGSPPATALKSIMKKKDCSVSAGKSAAKKNLKFVGINGGCNENKDATGLSSKPSECGDQRKQLPYSVETPYGFHLDLDFLKYVDDIEKGNTIRRVLIQRRTKAPKFSTLPRNFSLPDNSSRSLPRESWTSTCSLVPRSTSRDVEVQQIFEFRAAAHVSVGVSPRAPGVTSRSERAAAGDVRTRAFDEQPLGFRVRPQLLRASSMPVTVLQRKNSENSEDQTEPLPGHSTKDNGSSENVFCSNDCSSTQETAKNCEAVLTSEVSNLRQQLAAALQRIKVLEEQVKTFPELTEQVSTLTEEKGNLILQLNRQLAVSVQGFPQTTGSENTEHEKHSLHSLTSNSTAKNQIASSTDVLASATPLTTKASEDHSHSQQQKISTDHKELASTPMGSSLQDVAVCVTEGGAGSAAQKTNSDTEALTSIALRTKLTVLEKQLSDTTKELEKANTLLKQKVEENKVKELMLEQQSEQENSSPQLKGAEVGEQTEEVVKSKQSDYVQRCNASVNTEASSEVKTFSDKGTTTDMQIPTGSVECGAGTTITETPKKDLRSSSIQTDSLEVRSVGVVASVQTGEKSIAATVSACDKTIETDQPLIHVTCKPVEKKVADLEKESECMKQCASSRESDLTSVVGDCKSKEECVREVAQDCKKEGKGDREEPMPSSSMQATIGHYVTKIQQLLHEQWAVLENGYPELTSTLKQPASKISSIQEQLVSSLNALSSMYSSQAEKEATNGSSAQQAGSPPATALKSIMKKKDCSVSAGKSAAKKNLKFVGINGGYETTSSEESSGEDSRQDSSSGTEDGSSVPGDRASERETVQENFLAACHYLKDHLTETAFPNKEMRQCLRVVYQEWFRVSSQKASSADSVAGYLRELQAMTPELMGFIVNLADRNGNTALHYSVSHSNFHIVKLLLGTGGCKVDHQNKAGYTAIMLASLTATESQEEMEVALQLLRQGDINTRASQAGQTALMLAVSHGRTDMVRSLLACEADVNIQDDDGSTALMCACEHGHAEIVRLLLAQPGCRAQLADNDGNTALSIALEASLSEIADLLYTHAGQRDSPAS
ncbi:KN motif and ankyrin repeat domain-containing protein 4 [Acipenser ruthenus]|uniref:KN motif and ankyrin repeat domain-containing protein 4 n=1 Tax=Acipenser ruthenus TaxID=7906 RepID=A0A662YQH4_ACIRT|nr:KN motif and ankyrin repeat domain-containing protein 4 [Acipenser ruthenus]